MNKNKTLRYIHPVVGEVYIDKSCKCFELYEKKDIKGFNTAIQTAYFDCYKSYRPVG
jgi:uncharacterized CHY-type Zn-finger protein